MSPGHRSSFIRPALCALLLSLAVPAALFAQGTVRIAAYNIKHGEGMDGVVDLARAAEVLRALDADVITLQEIDRGVQRTDGVDQAVALGEMLGMDAYFGDFMPYQGGEYGMAVLSRLPVRRAHRPRRCPKRWTLASTPSYSRATSIRSVEIGSFRVSVVVTGS